MCAVLGNDNILDFLLQGIQPVVDRGGGVHAEVVDQHEEEGHQSGRGVCHLPSDTSTAAAHDHAGELHPNPRDNTAEDARAALLLQREAFLFLGINLANRQQSMRSIAMVEDVETQRVDRYMRRQGVELRVGSQPGGRVIVARAVLDGHATSVAAKDRVVVARNFHVLILIIILHFAHNAFIVIGIVVGVYIASFNKLKRKNNE